MSASISRFSLLAVAFAITAVLLFAPRADAAWGELDQTFAAPLGYTTQLPTGNLWGSASTVRIQADGKILIAGDSGATAFTRHPMIQRYLPDGTLDPSFASAGTLLLAAPAALADMDIVSIALQPDGKIVCAARTSGGGSIFRVTGGGQLDTTFASPLGYVLLNDDTPTDVLVHSSGDIYSGAHRDIGGNPVVRRFTTAGTQIGTFSSTSTSNLTSVQFSDYSDVLLKESAGDVVMVTTSEVAGTASFFAAKLNTTGALVNAWGTTGMATVGFSTDVEADAFTVQPSGALVIVGGTRSMGDAAWVIARFNAAGSLDPSFVGGGKQELSFGTGGDFAEAITSMPNGNLLVAGTLDDVVLNKYFGGLRVMTADGAPVEAFGPGGMRTFAPPSSTGFNSVAVQADGKIVGAGTLNNAPSPNVHFVARFQNDYVAPLIPVLSTKISSPKGSKISAKKLTRFSGTATVTNGTLAKVEVALQRVDSKLLKKKKRCSWLSSSKVKFKRVKAIKSKCSTPKWLNAAGTSEWSYKLAKKKRLPKGSYVLQVRAKAADGTVQSKATTKKFKVT